MALYDFVRDAINVAQKADNIDLMKQLLDIGQMALDLQNENSELKRKIDELDSLQAFEADIVPQQEPYFTLKSDAGTVDRYFCATCWGNSHKKIQMWYNGDRRLYCYACNTNFSITPKKRAQISY